MNVQPDVKNLVQKTQQYEFSDGLRDMQFAILMIGTGLTTWLIMDRADIWLVGIWRLADTLGSWARWLSMLLVFIPALLTAGALALMNYIRRRWLWQKSGFVKPMNIVVPRRVAFISVALFMVGMAIGLGGSFLGFSSDQFALRALFASSGWSFGYSLFGMGKSIDLQRYVRLGLIGGLASTILFILPITSGQAALILGLGWGIALIISGIRPFMNTVHTLREAHGER